MKFVISQPALLESLKIVSRAVSGQNTLPVLGNIMMKAEGKKVHFIATNLEISILTSAEATVKNEGSITVPAKILTSYASLLEKDEDIEMAVTGGTALEIKSQKSKTKIKGISADEFPSVSKVEGGTQVRIPSADFRRAIHRVGFAAQENSSRPILSGVYFSVAKKSLFFVATDSYRLSEEIIKLKEGPEDVSCVIPVRAMLEADRLVGMSEEVVLQIVENQVMFSVGKTHLVSRLIEGQFPDYKQIIPKNIKTTLEIDRGELELAVRRVSIFAKENNQHMKLDIQKDGQLIISTDATEIGEEKATLSVDLNGDPNIIALNSDYVLDILSALSDEDKVKIELEEKINPAIFKTAKGKDFTHLVMPLKM